MPSPSCEATHLAPGCPFLIEHVRVDEGSPPPPRNDHFHAVGEIVVFRRVNGCYFGDEGQFEVGPGTVVYVPPMRRHDFEIRAGACDWFLIMIDPVTLEGISRLKAPSGLTELVCATPDGSANTRLFHLAEWLAEIGPDDSRSMSLLQLLLDEVNRLAGIQVGRMSGVGYERLRPALEMLASQIAEVDLERAASACALSPRHFSRLFKQVFHMPFTDYVRERRLNSAAQHLTTTDRQVAQIAYELGFVAPAHFATLFRQRFGVSPVQYRAKGQRTH